MFGAGDSGIEQTATVAVCRREVSSMIIGPAAPTNGRCP